MLKKDKVNFIITKLDEIYPEVFPPLNHYNKSGNNTNQFKRGA